MSDPPPFDLDQAFFFLEQLDEQGRTALSLVCTLLDEVHQGALRRAARAEWALGRLSGWTCEVGITVDPSELLAEWDERNEPPLRPLADRYHTELSKRTAEVRTLRAQRDELLAEREELTLRAERAERALLHLHPENRQS
jgi:hypothetical protein